MTKTELIRNQSSLMSMEHRFEFQDESNFVERVIRTETDTFISKMRIPTNLSAIKDPRDAWDFTRWRGNVPSYPIQRKKVRVVDLFCGCGGFAWGIREGLLQKGIEPIITHAYDVDDNALKVYKRNLRPMNTSNESVAMQVDFSLRLLDRGARFAYPPEITQTSKSLAGEVGRTDIVIAGPPCQGHSNLNNHSRRKDPRNLLYLTTVAVACALRSRMVIIENVPEVQNDHFLVVERAKDLLEAEGYSVSSIVLDGTTVGLPQGRKRFFLVGTLQGQLNLLQALQNFEVTRARTVMQAIGDLIGVKKEAEFDRSANLSKENIARIEWLFDNGAYELANEQRPDCHKDGHSYPSVYGRLYPDKPAWTITTGLNSPGRGRFIHPTERRNITPHEAARLQGFDDEYDFGNDIGRNSMAKLIGDAVPPLFGNLISIFAPL